MNRGTRIVVIDDEPALQRTLAVNLRARGYEVAAFDTGEAGLRHLEAAGADLVLLDLMLPGMSGLQVCEAIRQEWTMPVLVLSARGEERAKVRALDLGADDYVTKPFGMDELLARVRALLRRPGQTEVEGGTLVTGDLAVDQASRQATVRGIPLDLTAREYDVLLYLMRNAGKVVTHRLLLSQVWGIEYTSETQYLRVFINRLRRKIEIEPSRPRIIVTEPGVGYRLLLPA